MAHQIGETVASLRGKEIRINVRFKWLLSLTVINLSQQLTHKLRRSLHARRTSCTNAIKDGEKCRITPLLAERSFYPGRFYESRQTHLGLD